MFKTASREFPTDNGEYHLIAVLNCTSDSFYDGGRYVDFANPVVPGANPVVPGANPVVPGAKATERIRTMVAAGAAIIDVGAESSRPGAVSVTADDELSRVIPLIQHIRMTFPACVISIDTTKSAVADVALTAGAEIVNDISGLTMDPAMAEAVIKHRASVIINHMQGTPQTMQVNPTYQDVVKEVKQFLLDRADALVKQGLTPEKIMIDPGIGFGKTLDHNLALLADLSSFRSAGYEVILGASRKSFIGKIVDSTPDERLPGTIAANVLAYQQGVRFFRVHDVTENNQALAVAKRIMMTE